MPVSHLRGPDDPEPGHRTPAPGELRLVQLFVNSVDLEDDLEAWSSPAALRDWLVDRDLLAPNARVAAADPATAIEVRESLRALLLANNGVPLDPVVPRRLERAAADARLSLRFGDDGRAVLRPAAGGVAGAIGEVLAVVQRAMADGTWHRLKACPYDTCRWAFYDHSKNRSSRWCSMSGCGNRAKAAAFRERRRRA
jgi:predicted RNA-binding Zn ribbon-like protein